ncbi:HIT family protein [Desemzia incerta]|uniref:HIT family protein n=1 Tax=Desemzia incerta TaxID=82801 RepID=UPI0024C42DFF|nr:HIT family protein [Desemzia incerta]WHZ31323.1 HIT family protein [Desemzia incerta]
MEDCIFCKIIKNEIPSRKVYEDEDVIAFLDLTQVTKGHTLVVPKKHVADIYEYDEELAARTFSRIPKIARGLRDSDPSIKGMNILNNNGELAYQSVFHSHIHLIPRYTETDTFSVEFGDNSQKHSPEELDTIKNAIQTRMEE